MGALFDFAKFDSVSVTFQGLGTVWRRLMERSTAGTLEQGWAFSNTRAIQSSQKRVVGVSHLHAVVFWPNIDECVEEPLQGYQERI